MGGVERCALGLCERKTALLNGLSSERMACVFFSPGDTIWTTREFDSKFLMYICFLGTGSRWQRLFSRRVKEAFFFLSFLLLIF